MTDAATLARCLTYVETQVGPTKAAPRHVPPPTVTISRQVGTGGAAMAAALASFLQAQRPGARVPWTVFDRTLVERMLSDHNLPAQLSRYIPESRVSYIQDTLEELFGLHPSNTSLVTQVTETILSLAELGNCILLGRGANVILRRAPAVLHVRLVGSPERRRERIEAERHLGSAEAEEYLRHEDAARARYLKANFDAEIDDPLAYHLVLNTDCFEPEAAAELAGRAVLCKFPPAA